MNPTPLPEPEHSPLTQSKPRSNKKIGKAHLLSLFLATVMVVVGGFTLNQWASGDGLLPFGISGGDNLTQQQIDARKSAFNQMNQNGGFDVRVHSMQEGLDFLLNSPSADRAVIIDIMHQWSDRGDVRVAEITLWDDVEQDGDIVKFTSMGFSQQINLTHAPQTLYLPIQVGQSAQMIGLHDGGGGITLGFMVAGQPVQAPVLAPNQTIDVHFF